MRLPTLVGRFVFTLHSDDNVLANVRTRLSKSHYCHLSPISPSCIPRHPTATEDPSSPPQTTRLNDPVPRPTTTWSCKERNMSGPSHPFLNALTHMSLFY